MLILIFYMIHILFNSSIIYVQMRRMSTTELFPHFLGLLSLSRLVHLSVNLFSQNIHKYLNRILEVFVFLFLFLCKRSRVQYCGFRLLRYCLFCPHLGGAHQKWFSTIKIDFVSSMQMVLLMFFFLDEFTFHNCNKITFTIPT